MSTKNLVLLWFRETFDLHTFQKMIWKRKKNRSKKCSRKICSWLDKNKFQMIPRKTKNSQIKKFEIFCWIFFREFFFNFLEPLKRMQVQVLTKSEQNYIFRRILFVGTSLNCRNLKWKFHDSYAGSYADQPCRTSRRNRGQKQERTWTQN